MSTQPINDSITPAQSSASAAAESEISDELRSNLLETIRKSGHYISEHHPDFERLNGDKEFMLKAVQLNGFNLMHANENLKNDIDVVLEAVRCENPDSDSDSLAIQIPQEMDDNFISPILIPTPFDYASDDLKKNEAFVKKVVEINGLNLQHASAELRNNEEVVLAAVRQNGLALEHASAELRNNEEIVVEAISQNGGALIYAGEALRKKYASGLPGAKTKSAGKT